MGAQHAWHCRCSLGHWRATQAERAALCTGGTEPLLRLSVPSTAPDNAGVRPAVSCGTRPGVGAVVSCGTCPAVGAVVRAPCNSNYRWPSPAAPAGAAWGASGPVWELWLHCWDAGRLVQSVSATRGPSLLNAVCKPCPTPADPRGMVWPRPTPGMSQPLHAAATSTFAQEAISPAAGARPTPAPCLPPQRPPPPRSCTPPCGASSEPSHTRGRSTCVG